MKFSSLVVLAATLAIGVEAGHSDIGARHHNVARKNNRRCKNRPSQATHLTQLAEAAKPAPVEPVSKPAPEPAAPPPPPPPPAPAAPAGTIQVDESACGWSGATTEITSTGGPNGQQDFLNCGVTTGGWNPPFIRIDQVVAVDLGAALARPGNPFTACGAFIDKFYAYGGEFGIPAIMLASFAMQESSCNPATTGGGGEVGLMQLTHDKCGGAPGGNCYDPDYNIRTAAQYFRNTLDGFGGSFLEALGQYNGWRRGLTFESATAARYSGCCRCQNNLDYLQQYLNGWLQGSNAYNHNNRLGKFFNLDVC